MCLPNLALRAQRRSGAECTGFLVGRTAHLSWLGVPLDARGRGEATRVIYKWLRAALQKRPALTTIMLDDMSDFARHRRKNIYVRLGLHYDEISGRACEMQARIRLVLRRCRNMLQTK
jgi:hypothetical protein